MFCYGKGLQYWFKGYSSISLIDACENKSLFLIDKKERTHSQCLTEKIYIFNSQELSDN